MAKFIFTGEEYLNADHIVSIDVPPCSETIWFCLDSGVKLARSRKYLEAILKTLDVDQNFQS